MKELNHLRQHATKEEKEKLNFESLKTTNVTTCIYGQMTGKCSSPRAKELYSKVYNNLLGIGINFERTFAEDTIYGFTPLESYITMFSNYSTHLKEILEFIKEERDEITLDLEKIKKRFKVIGYKKNKDD